MCLPIDIHKVRVCMFALRHRSPVFAPSKNNTLCTGVVTQSGPLARETVAFVFIFLLLYFIGGNMTLCLVVTA